MTVLTNSNQKPIIKVHNLGTRFNTHWVHKGLNLEILPNRIIAIIGDSGAGKTTLMRQILMLEEIAEGSIYLMGECVTEVAPGSKESKLMASKMGMMFQKGALFSSLTVLENIMYPLQEYTDFSYHTLEEIAKVKLNLVGLPKSAFNLFPADLSGGMIKRTALARAIALDPEVIFLDEPSAGLDPNSAHELDILIKELQESLSLTVIMVTHDLDTLWHIVDEVVYLGNRKVLLHDTIANAAENKEHEALYNYFNGPRGHKVKAIHKSSLPASLRNTSDEK
ncbi:MAG: ATP-binding cassette domain-containing protein [Gammaproteobacteria bacterium]|nr:MAG: ATP-binding cassette domain-containing protein [Gammaproteobacteria bacterium]UTW43691.1 ATP-binding cassette domain-containing protein [bacterium SCSIO 12844]